MIESKIYTKYIMTTPAAEENPGLKLPLII
jgi:hypothetical protein